VKGSRGCGSASSAIRTVSGQHEKGVEALASHGVECVLHCGDIGSSEIVPLFGRWPTHFVFGNCDHDHDELTRVIELTEQTSHGQFGSIELGGCRIGLLHGHDSRRFRETIASQKYGLVCYGQPTFPSTITKAKRWC